MDVSTGGLLGGGRWRSDWLRGTKVTQGRLTQQMVVVLKLCVYMYMYNSDFYSFFNLLLVPMRIIIFFLLEISPMRKVDVVGVSVMVVVVSCSIAGVAKESRRHVTVIGGWGVITPTLDQTDPCSIKLR